MKNLQKIILGLLMATGFSKTTLFTNCRIYQHPNENAILCEDGIIKAIGHESKLRADNTIDLRGGFVYPGFTDAHLHLAGLGWSLETLNLVGTGSAAEVAAKVKKAVVQRSMKKTQNGGRQWILGRGWDQNDWQIIKYPDKETLDAVAPDDPVFLKRIDGHAVWVNSVVLKICGISGITQDPDGGKILRDDNGEPTGILIDKAIELITSYIPMDSPETIRRQVLEACELLNSLGITSIHDAGTDITTISVLRDLITEKKLSVRVYAMLNSYPKDYESFLASGPETGNPFLKIRSIKMYLDGALGSRGAALLKPYSDDPENTGLILTDSLAVLRQVERFNQAGFQVAIHCIGDRANRVALDIFEQVQRNVSGNHRNRIEHAQIVHPQDIPRFAELSVIPAMQATHCTSDMYWADERLGEERLNEAYPWQSLVQAGSIIPGGSDAPVEFPNPLEGIYAGVTRQDKKGWPPGGWQHHECLTMEQSLKMYTEWPAYASFEEDVKGKITPGFFADFTVLSNDLESIPSKNILETEILFTIVNSTIVYSRQDRKIR